MARPVARRVRPDARTLLAQRVSEQTPWGAPPATAQTQRAGPRRMRQAVPRRVGAIPEARARRLAEPRLEAPRLLAPAPPETRAPVTMAATPASAAPRVSGCARSSPARTRPIAVRETRRHSFGLARATPAAAPNPAGCAPPCGVAATLMERSRPTNASAAGASRVSGSATATAARMATTVPPKGSALQG